MTLPRIDVLRAAGALSALDEQFATAMIRLSGDARPEIQLAAALASRAVAAGHVCLDLQRLVEQPVAALIEESHPEVAAAAWPDLDRWHDLLRSSPLIGDGDAFTPLVLDAHGRLYLRRYWEHERCLAQALAERAQRVEASLDGAWLRDRLDRLFPPNTAMEIDPQRLAAFTAVYRKLCVISGGPGTGKTYTVAKILALLIEQALHGERPVPRMTLVAPTGKAAARLVEALRRTKIGLPCAEAVVRQIPDEAATIHRCLGSIGGSSTRFRHHAENPLASDVVVVDEASMVDLALMTRLVNAVPQQARLLLLGDEDQLASVEAGAVLGDICNAGRQRRYSTAFANAAQQLGGARLPSSANAPAHTSIWDCIVRLTHSYRYGPSSGIGELARAINAGDAAAALAVLDDQRFPDVTLVFPTPGEQLSTTLRGAVLRGFAPALQADVPAAQRLHALERFRVLCAHRRGARGVQTVNRLVEAALSDEGLIHPNVGSYVGRPVIVTHNDYQIGLFNGDVGMILPAAAEARTAAAFVGEHGALRWLSPSRLPPHETVFAMSVHKSQGSEFDEVAVVLPDDMSGVLSRELLYTAVTRARTAVTIHAPRAVVEQTIARCIERTSGLRDRLWL